MNRYKLLKSIDYSVPCSHTGLGHNGRNSHPFGSHSPIVQVNIDFEKGKLCLEGTSELISCSGRRRGVTNTKADKRKIIVKATIYPGPGIELSEHIEKDFAFSLEGTIDDGKSIHTCSGLLVINGTARMNRAGYKEWLLTVRLYDDYNQAREIALRLTMYSISEKAALN